MIWQTIRDELSTPSGQTGPLSPAYRRAVEGMGHAVLGAALTTTGGVWGLGGAFAIAVAYWLAKERADLRRGGKVWDGIEDAALTGFGALYGAIWWPAALIGFAGLVLVSAALRIK